MTLSERKPKTAARPLIRALAGVGVTLALGVAALLTPGPSPAMAQDRPDPQRSGVPSPPDLAPLASPAATTRAPTPTEALFDAVARNDMAQVQAALTRGADLNARNSLGMTATEMAVDRGYFDIGHFLLSSRTARPGSGPAGAASPAAAARLPDPPPNATTQAAPVRSVDRLEIAPPIPAGPAPTTGARTATGGSNDPFNPGAAPLGARLPVLGPPANTTTPATAAPADTTPAPRDAKPAAGTGPDDATQSGVRQPDAPPPAAAPAASSIPAQQPSRWRRITDWLTPWRKPAEPKGDERTDILPDERPSAPAHQGISSQPPLVLASATAHAAPASASDSVWAPMLADPPHAIAADRPAPQSADTPGAQPGSTAVRGAAWIPEPERANGQKSRPASAPNTASATALMDGPETSTQEADAAPASAGSANGSPPPSPSFMERLYGFLYSVPGSPSIIADIPVPLPAGSAHLTASTAPIPPAAPVAVAVSGSWQPSVEPAGHAITQVASLDRTGSLGGPTAAMADPPVDIAAEVIPAPVKAADAHTIPTVAATRPLTLDDALRPLRRPPSAGVSAGGAADPFDPANAPTGASLPILSTADLENLRAAPRASTNDPAGTASSAPGPRAQRPTAAESPPANDPQGTGPTAAAQPVPTRAGLPDANRAITPATAPAPAADTTLAQPPEYLFNTADSKAAAAPNAPATTAARALLVALENRAVQTIDPAKPQSSTFARMAAARTITPDGRLEVTIGEVAAPLTGTTFNLGQGMAVGKPLPPKPSDRRAKNPCLYKDQGLVSFCVEPIDWPGDIAAAFYTSSVLYEGRQAVVRYEGDKASFIHTLINADTFDKVVAYFEQMYGPATEVVARLIAPLAAPREINPAAVWRSFDPASNIMTTLEVRSLDDARGTFPDARHGAVLLYRAWARPVFPQLSSVELLLLR